jgi:hypothetical protein
MVLQRLFLEPYNVSYSGLIDILNGYNSIGFIIVFMNNFLSGMLALVRLVIPEERIENY